MAIRKILKDSDPSLRKICKEVTEFDGRLHELIDDMLETLKKANGAGLAANQIGVLKRICIVAIDDEIVELINPVITRFSPTEIVFKEGCLSVYREGRLLYADVKRPRRVTVEAQDRFGNPVKYKWDGFKSRAAQHEIDHLNGILFVDKIEKEIDNTDI